MAEVLATHVICRGVTYPIAVWQVVWEYIERGRAPDAEFNRRVTRYVTQDEAYTLYRAQRWTPEECEFTTEIVDLTISSTTGGHTLPTEEIHSYKSGDRVAVTATADSGYEFDHWELDGKDIGKTIPIRVLMDKAHELHAVFKSVLTECRLWTFTRYYKYTPLDAPKKDWRNFELTIVLPFLADWTEEDVVKYEKAIIKLCDGIMRVDLWTGSGYDNDTWRDIYETEPLLSQMETGWAVIPGTDTARGWERGGIKKLDITETQTVEWEVEDKIGHYFKRVRRGRVEWEVPTE